MNEKINYQKQLDEILKTIKSDAINKPTLLLHACCAPCSSYVIEFLAKFFNITIFYYNPNIHPKAEYERRLSELEKFLSEFPEAIRTKVHLQKTYYNPEDFFSATNTRIETALQIEPEKGERCRRCYEFRMKKAFAFAKENNFDFFTTTLSISPHKDEQKINNIGYTLVQLNNISNSPSYLPADFKKKGGYLRSTQLSKEYGLYRQDYCGCVFSASKTNGHTRNENILTLDSLKN